MLSLGIGAVQFVPGFELISQAARSSHDYGFFTSKILIQWWQLVGVFIPDFFGNPAIALGYSPYLVRHSSASL